MSIFVDDKDVAKVQTATSQVLKDAIGQIASVLVPAIVDAAKNSLGGINATITVGPIKMEPIQIVVALK